MDKLVTQIHDMLMGKRDPDKVEHSAAKAGSEIASLLFERFARTRKPPTVADKVLRMSAAGSPCLRKLWFKLRPGVPAEPLTPAAHIKFMYGDLIESLIVFLLRISGVKVADQQRMIECGLPNGWTVRGRTDLSVGDVVVDVKSAAPFSMKKFETGDFGDDPFGYVTQLAMYRDFGKYKKGRWLAMNKVTGKLVETPLKADATREDDLVFITNAIENPTMPERGDNAAPVAEGQNKRLCTMCSYCEYKKVCYKDANGGAGLKKYIYAKGPVWLTEVKKAPRVPEVDDDDQTG